jgi:hypothetical protein
MPKNGKTKRIAVLNPTLFWDVKRIDINKHADFIIARVLDYGDQKDLRNLRKIYPDEKLIHVVKNRRGLLPETVNFWSLYFHIPKSEIACLKKY